MPGFSSSTKKPKNDSQSTTKEKKSFSLYAVVAWLFAVKEREELDAKTGGDKSDGAWKWGL